MEPFINVTPPALRVPLEPTAIRLVDGDNHLAEDVAQTVFIDLARKACGLCDGIMLGGWLHRRTCHVAATMLRSERRRRLQEDVEVLAPVRRIDDERHHEPRIA